jgi:hypothetical protein
MANIKLSETLIGREVERLFSELRARRGDLCKNPVTGAGFVYGVDPTGRQKKAAYSALSAREWFAFNAPADAQPLPVTYGDREDLKRRCGLLLYIVALYGRSLEGRNYDVNEHPPFADYISGVLWEAERVDGIIGTLPYYPTELPELKKRFPPRELSGMGPGFCWLSPEEYPKYMQQYRYNRARQAEIAKEVQRMRLAPIYESARNADAVRRAEALAESLYKAAEN